MKQSISARVTLIIIALGVTYGFFSGALSQENFMILASMVFGAFFAQSDRM